MVLFMNFGLAYKSVLPSFHPFDLVVGLVGAAALKAVIYFKGKNAKKYRQGEEYGSARWGNQKDIEPFINIGLAILECDEAAKDIKDGDEVKVDFDTGVIENVTTGKTYQAEPFPPFIQNIISKGGLLKSIGK